MADQNARQVEKRAGPGRKWFLSANLLLEGDVVYRTAAGGWSRSVAKAAIAESEEAAAALIQAAAADAHLVASAELAEARIDAEGRAAPSSLRERIRALGPTHRPDLGKQAERGLAFAAAEAA